MKSPKLFSSLAAAAAFPPLTVAGTENTGRCGRLLPAADDDAGATVATVLPNPTDAMLLASLEQQDDFLEAVRSRRYISEEWSGGCLGGVVMGRAWRPQAAYPQRARPPPAGGVETCRGRAREGLAAETDEVDVVGPQAPGFERGNGDAARERAT
jgi:hypothetical protein